MSLNTSAPTPDYQCFALTESGAGEPCDNGLTLVCKPGLYCNGKSKQCVPLGKLGDPCTGLGAAGCVTPLYCAGSPSTCRAPGPAGTPCNDPAVGSFGCSTGLACATSGDCEPVSWGEPGDPCDGILQLCRRGSCPTSAITGAPMPGACPTIIADGLPCTDTDTCDTYSECVSGLSVARATTGTCEPRSDVICM
jgi:hypothetical protein